MPAMQLTPDNPGRMTPHFAQGVRYNNWLNIVGRAGRLYISKMGIYERNKVWT